MPGAIVLFFDIGDTLAVPALTASGALDKLVVFPLVTDVLARFRAMTGPGGLPIRLGIISNTGTETLATMKNHLSAAGLLASFEEALLVFSSVEGDDKSTKEIFNRARTRAGVAANRCIYISESERERNVAASAGFRVSFHPLHAFHVVGQIQP
jgi:FMN phosphatase YigB (HAD superfamily)